MVVLVRPIPILLVAKAVATEPLKSVCSPSVRERATPVDDRVIVVIEGLLALRLLAPLKNVTPQNNQKLLLATEVLLESPLAVPL